MQDRNARIGLWMFGVYLLAYGVFVLLAAPGILKLVGVVNVLVRSVPRLLWQGLLHLKFPRRLLSGIPK